MKDLALYLVLRLLPGFGALNFLQELLHLLRSSGVFFLSFRRRLRSFNHNLR